MSHFGCQSGYQHKLWGSKLSTKNAQMLNIIFVDVSCHFEDLNFYPPPTCNLVLGTKKKKKKNMDAKRLRLLHCMSEARRDKWFVPSPSVCRPSSLDMNHTPNWYLTLPTDLLTHPSHWFVCVCVCVCVCCIFSLLRCLKKRRVIIGRPVVSGSTRPLVYTPRVSPHHQSRCYAPAPKCYLLLSHLYVQEVACHSWCWVKSSCACHNDNVVHKKPFFTQTNSIGQSPLRIKLVLVCVLTSTGHETSQLLA